MIKKVSFTWKTITKTILLLIFLLLLGTYIFSKLASPFTKGQLIGYSGATGFTLRPHLHFSVKTKLNYDKDAFVQTKFITTNGIQILQSGNSYERSEE